MTQGPIPVEMANTMIQDYISYMESQGIDMSKQTQSITFTGPELMAWLREVMSYSNEFRICLGVYGKEDINAGRITAIIWPYQDGQPASQPYLEGKDDPPPPPPTDPYNQGSMNP